MFIWPALPIHMSIGFVISRLINIHYILYKYMGQKLAKRRIVWSLVTNFLKQNSFYVITKYFYFILHYSVVRHLNWCFIPHLYYNLNNSGPNSWKLLNNSANLLIESNHVKRNCNFMSVYFLIAMPWCGFEWRLEVCHILLGVVDWDDLAMSKESAWEISCSLEVPVPKSKNMGRKTWR
jgi:hypothetical protein